MSEWVSSILDAVIDNEEEQGEAISTEDLLSQVDALNSNWETRGEKRTSRNTFLGSLDATALYPSLDNKKVAKLCGEMVRESTLKFEGIDWKWASLYVALNSKPWQIISWRMTDIIPKRRFKQGQQPTIRGASDPMAEFRWKWEKPVEEYSDEEKRILI